jgi:DNA-directed RNA polymerase subunit RPC12/RpoP
MTDEGTIRFSCWKCGKTFEVGLRSEGKIFDCSSCGARNVAVEESEARRREDFEKHYLKCPTCNRWMKKDFEDCLNCGRPFRDDARLREFMKREPEIKASLARTVTDAPVDPPAPARSLAWIFILLAGIVAAAAVLGALILLGSGF